MPGFVTRTGYWRGSVILARGLRASARGIIGIGEDVAASAKRRSRVRTGTYKRSHHAAPKGYEGSNDAQYAHGQDLQSAHNLGTDQVLHAGPESAILEVGSWVPYACVIETGLGDHTVTEAVEEARSRSTGKMVRAWREEGL